MKNVKLFGGRRDICTEKVTDASRSPPLSHLAADREVENIMLLAIELYNPAHRYYLILDYAEHF